MFKRSFSLFLFLPFSLPFSTPFFLCGFLTRPQFKVELDQQATSDQIYETKNSVLKSLNFLCFEQEVVAL